MDDALVFVKPNTNPPPPGPNLHKPVAMLADL